MSTTTSPTAIPAAHRSALEGYEARLFIATTATPGELVAYRTAPPAWERRFGIVTAVLRDPAGLPVVVVDDQVALSAHDLEAPGRSPLGPWFLLSGDAIEVLRSGTWHLTTVTRVLGPRACTPDYTVAGFRGQFAGAAVRLPE